jgi:hypothetical protein
MDSLLSGASCEDSDKGQSYLQQKNSFFFLTSRQIACEIGSHFPMDKSYVFWLIVFLYGCQDAWCLSLLCEVPSNESSEFFICLQLSTDILFSDQLIEY